MRDVVELNISLRRDVAALNHGVTQEVPALRRHVEAKGGNLYGGSSVLSDVSDLEAKPYRTTVLSEAFGRGMLDITSQQIVIGVSSDKLGLELYNFFRRANPALIMLSASSPYRYAEGSKLEKTGRLSRRISQYEHSCRFYPEEMWRDQPEIHRMDDYRARLKEVSDLVKRRMRNGQLDSRNGILHGGPDGYSSFAVFDVLLPHQIYWPTRIRPDHRNIESGGESAMSIELRICDMPTNIATMRAINAFVVGLSYYIENNGKIDLPDQFDGSFSDLKNAAETRLRSAPQPVRQLLQELRRKAKQGLRMNGNRDEAAHLEIVDSMIAKGNAAERMLLKGFSTPSELREYLINRLRSND